MRSWARFTKWSALAAVAGLAAAAGLAALLGTPIWIGLLAAAVGIVAATLIARRLGIAPSPVVVFSGAILGSFLGGAGFAAVGALSPAAAVAPGATEGAIIGGSAVAGGAYGGFAAAAFKVMLTDEELENRRRDFDESVWGPERLAQFEEERAQRAREQQAPSQTGGFVGKLR